MDQETGCPIVGIGSSAGGIEALQGFFRNLPATTGLGFVVVTHLAPGHVSVLTEILGRFTPMPVLRAQTGHTVQPDHVYVAPPQTIVSLAAGRLQLAELGPVRRVRNPIDIFLASLAEDRRERAVGIILSGSGSDGTLGIKAIKEQGGLTIAQGSDHSAPRHQGMPASAIASGLVDLELAVEEMPARLVAHASGLAGSGHDRLEEAEPRMAIEPVYAILRERVRHDFSDYKEQTFLRRVGRRMQVLQIETIDAYVERLRKDADEVGALFRDLLIGVTSFFRDSEAFEALERTVIPRLFEGKGAGRHGAGLGARAAPPARRSTRWRSCCASTGDAAEPAEGADLRHRHRRGGARRSPAPAATRRSCWAASRPERRERFFAADAGTYRAWPRRCASSASSPRTASSATRRSRASTSSPAATC